MQLDYYKLLGISLSADLEEIKQAAQTKANKIKTAFAVLSQAETRTDYDANLSHVETRTAYNAQLNPGLHNHYATLAVSREANLAKIQAAAQARITEIEEAYKNLSKPETRAVYDSHLQSLKPPTAVASSKPQIENVVLKQKSVPLPDQDMSQVPPYRSSTVSFTNTDRHTTEIELAERGTRLKAVLYDVLIIGVLLVLRSMFATDHLTEQFVPTASFLVPVIGVIMLNLVLLYRHGQTLGKHICSIKIVNAEGGRAGLGILLMRILVALGIPLLAAILLIKGLALPIIGISTIAIALLDPLFIVQNSRRCLHDLITKTIVVKVFPGEAAAPVLIERQKDIAYNVTYKFMEIIAKVGLSFIPFSSLILKWDEQRPADIEIHPATVRQGPPASKSILLLLTLFLGWFGAHHFYLGHYARGTMYLLFCWTWIPGWFAVIEFLFTSNDSIEIEHDYTADNSVVAFIFIPIPIIFLGLFVLAQWTAYTDDLKRGIERGKVSKAIELLNSLKTPAEQYMAAKGEFPPTIEEVTNKTSGNDLATLTSNPEAYYFEATMNPQDNVLAGKVVLLIFHRNSETWRCRTPSPKGIPPEYLPTECNSSNAEVIANIDYWKREKKREKVSEAIQLLREKVSEAIQLLGGLKTPAEEYIAAKGEFPPTIDVLMDITRGKYVAYLVSNPNEFYFEATMSEEDSVLAGKRVRLTYHTDTNIWVCSAAYPNGIPQQYLPNACK